jgi:hypothetical protein
MATSSCSGDPAPTTPCFVPVSCAVGRFGKAKPVWDPCTATYVVDPLVNLRNQVQVQALSAAVSGVQVRPRNACTPAPGTTSGRSESSMTGALNCAGGCGPVNPVYYTGGLRGGVLNTSRTNTTTASNCAGGNCRPFLPLYPTAAASTTRSGCGLLGQGGFRL